MAKIITTITFDGPSFHVDVTGATGKSCTGLTQEIENALGDTGERILKPEYHKREPAAVRRQNTLRTGQ